MCKLKKNQNQKHHSSQDKKIQSYKSKIEEVQKFNAEKGKEYERKIQGLKQLLVWISFGRRD